MGKIINDAELASDASTLSAVLVNEGLHIRVHTRRICTSAEYFLAFQNSVLQTKYPFSSSCSFLCSK